MTIQVNQVNDVMEDDVFAYDKQEGDDKDIPTYPTKEERAELVREYEELEMQAAEGDSTQAQILRKLNELTGTVKKCEPIPTREAVVEFLESHKNMGSSKRTITHYRGVLKRFATEYPELPLEPKAIEAFISQWDGATRVDYFKVVGRLYRFLIKRGKISVDPTQRVIHRPKPTTNLVPSLDQKEYARIFALPESELSQRDRAYFLLSIGTGVRVGEVINATFQHIGENTFTVPAEGKTGERLVPLKPGIRNALLSLKDGHKDTDPIFWSYHHKTPLTTETAFLFIVRKAFKAAKIEGKRASPHTLRHTFARNWIANEGDLFSLMRILGHKRVETTQKYVYQVAADLVEKNKKHNPLVGLLDDSLFSKERSISPEERSISSEDNRLSL